MCEAGTKNVRIVLCLVQIAARDSGLERSHRSENTVTIFKINDDAIGPAISFRQPAQPAIRRVQFIKRASDLGKRYALASLRNPERRLRSELEAPV